MLAAALALALPPLLQEPLFPKPKGAPPAAAAPKPAPRDEPPLGEGAARLLVARYRDEDTWALKSIILVALGPRWPAAGAPIVADALTHKDPRLHAFAVEALRRTDPAWLRAAATREVVEGLLKRLDTKNTLLRSRVVEVLRAIEPSIAKDDAYAWQSWWQKAKANYAPAPAPPEPASRPASGPSEEGGTAAERFVARAVDLAEGGLEVAFCIDATGSMQPTIDATRDAVRDVVALLGGIVPHVRLGLVYYKDTSDFPAGARVLSRVDEPPDRTEKRLAALSASGGGDIPEAVDKGLALALDPKEMGWTLAANKVIVILGDAQPHDLERTKEIARGGLEKPFGKTPAVYTGEKAKKDTVRPFITSTIVVGEMEPAVHAMKEIAEAGGGACGKLAFDGASNGSESVVANILALSFGKRFQEQARVFVEIYQEYRRAGFIR